MRSNPGYMEIVTAISEQLHQAQQALSNDLLQAVATKRWEKFLRDKHDVKALVDHIDHLSLDNEFVFQLHAAADKARQSPRKPGRPRKATLSPAEE